MICVVPPDPLWNLIDPSVPTWTVTRFGIVAPAAQFRFDAVGNALVPGYTVKNPPAWVSVTVVFTTTAATPVAGRPPLPKIPRFKSPPAATAPLDRVSSTRAGDNATN